MVHLPDLCNIINGLIQIICLQTVQLIFIRLAAQLFILNLKIFILQTIFIWILTNGLNLQKMIKISNSGKIKSY